MNFSRVRAQTALPQPNWLAREYESASLIVCGGSSLCPQPSSCTVVVVQPVSHVVCCLTAVALILPSLARYPPQPSLVLSFMARMDATGPVT
jgi:hypothetical protein